jgi:hypothetical protein
MKKVQNEVSVIGLGMVGCRSEAAALRGNLHGDEP